MNDIAKKKSKGPIRFELIIPITLIILGVGLYFTHFFDSHLKKAMEWGLGKVNGAEVNVKKVSTSFLRLNLSIHDVQVTNKEKATHNLIRLGLFNFELNPDALLRLKFVIEKAQLEQIEYDSPRSKPGEVYPVKPKDGPGLLAKAQEEIMDNVQKESEGSVLGDAIALTQGSDWQDQLKTIQSSLQTEARIKELQTDLNNKNNYWKEEIKNIGKFDEFKKIESKVNEIKNEKNVLAQAKGAQEISKLTKDLELEFKEKKSKVQTLQTEIKAITQYPKEIEGLIKKDIDSLRSRLNLPSLDMKGMAMAMFGRELAKYMGEVKKYQMLAEEYMPPKKEKKDELIPPPRSIGKTFDFPITKGYPLFWLKHSSISSKLTDSAFSGNFSGELKDVTTSPKTVGKPAVLDLKGDLTTQNISGIRLIATIDHTKQIPKQFLDFKVGSFPVANKMLVTEKNIELGLNQAEGSLLFMASLEEQNININWLTSFSKTNFHLKSNKHVEELLGNVLNKIPVVTVESKITGFWKKPKIHLESNLAEELSQGLKREVQAKIDEAKIKIESMVKDKIKVEQNKLLADVNFAQKDLQAQLTSHLGKLDSQKNFLTKEIEKLKSGALNKEKDKLKDTGKKLLKGFKL